MMSSPRAGTPSGQALPAELHLAAGMVGFPQAREFSCQPLGEGLEPFYLLRATDAAGIEFVVVEPGLLYTDYEVEVGAEVGERLGIPSPSEAVVLALVTVREPPTVNLLGPLVCHRRTGEAAQVVQARPYGAAVALPANPPQPLSQAGSPG